MSDIWSRAWCQTQQIPNFQTQGMTSENEVRDAPQYVPRVFSTPTQYGSIFDTSRSPTPEDDSGGLCFQFRQCKSKKKTPRTPIVIRKPRYVLEKIANFKAPEPEYLPSSLPPSPNGRVEAPISPGRVRLRRTLSRTPSTISSGYLYRISSCSLSPPPTPSSGLKTPPSPPLSHKLPTSELMTGLNNVQETEGTTEIDRKEVGKPDQCYRAPSRNCTSKSPPSTPSLHMERQEQRQQTINLNNGNNKNFVVLSQKSPKKNRPKKNDTHIVSSNLDLREISSSRDGIGRHITRNLVNEQNVTINNNRNKEKGMLSEHRRPTSPEQSYLVPEEKYLNQIEQDPANKLQYNNVQRYLESVQISDKESDLIDMETNTAKHDNSIPDSHFYHQQLKDDFREDKRAVADNKQARLGKKMTHVNIENIKESNSSKESLRKENTLSSVIKTNKGANCKQNNSAERKTNQYQVDKSKAPFSFIKKKSSFVFLGQGGQILAESSSETAGEKDVVVKNVRTSMLNGIASETKPVKKCDSFNSENEFEVEKIQAWQKMREISAKFESKRNKNACREIPIYPCNPYNKTDSTKINGGQKSSKVKLRNMFAMFGSEGQSIDKSLSPNQTSDLDGQQNYVGKDHYLLQKSDAQNNPENKIQTNTGPQSPEIDRKVLSLINKSVHHRINNIPRQDTFESQASEDSDTNMPNLQKISDSKTSNITKLRILSDKMYKSPLMKKRSKDETNN